MDINEFAVKVRAAVLVVKANGWLLEQGVTVDPSVNGNDDLICPLGAVYVGDAKPEDFESEVQFDDAIYDADIDEDEAVAFANGFDGVARENTDTESSWYQLGRDIAKENGL